MCGRCETRMSADNGWRCVIASPCLCCDCEPFCLKETAGFVGRVGMPRKRENGRPQRGWGWPCFISWASEITMQEIPPSKYFLLFWGCRYEKGGSEGNSDPQTDGQSWLNYLSICKEILSPWNRWTILIKHSIYHRLIIYHRIYISFYYLTIMYLLNLSIICLFTYYLLIHLSRNL